MTPIGAIAAAPVAPLSGPLPLGATAVVVTVKHWWESSEIVTSLGVILAAGVDSTFNAVIPLLGSGPVDKTAIKGALIRSFLVGAYGAFIAIRRKSSNSAVR